jgi:hypothetical protein
VTQDRTHLTGGEIQNGTIIGVVHVAAPRTIDDHRFEARPVTNQVLVRSVPELGICISRHARNHSWPPALTAANIFDEKHNCQCRPRRIADRPRDYEELLDADH